LRRKNYRYFVAAGLVFLLLGMCGCGKKENPRVPSLSPPVVISNLEASRQDDSVRLRFTVRGKVDDIGSVRIVRNKLGIDAGECPGCPRAYEQIAELTPKDLQAAGSGNGYSYRDYSVERGYRYLYKIIVDYSDGTKGGEFITEEVTFELNSE
jgi:hypothetical protein